MLLDADLLHEVPVELGAAHLAELLDLVTLAARRRRRKFDVLRVRELHELVVRLLVILHELVREVLHAGVGRLRRGELRDLHFEHAAFGRVLDELAIAARQHRGLARVGVAGSGYQAAAALRLE